MRIWVGMVKMDNMGGNGYYENRNVRIEIGRVVIDMNV